MVSGYGHAQEERYSMMTCKSEKLFLKCWRAIKNTSINHENRHTNFVDDPHYTRKRGRTGYTAKKKIRYGRFLR